MHNLCLNYNVRTADVFKMFNLITVGKSILKEICKNYELTFKKICILFKYNEWTRSIHRRECHGAFESHGKFPNLITWRSIHVILLSKGTYKKTLA